MKKRLVILAIFTLCFFAWAKDYRETYPGKLYNFTYKDEEGEHSDFMLRNYEKILEIVNENLTGRHTFFIVQYIFGNFTNSGKIEVLVCFNKELFRSEDFFTIRKIGLFIFNEDQDVISCYYTDNYCVSLLNKERCYECIPLGKRYSEGWVCDLNGNGKQELIFSHGQAMNSAMCILEYSDGALVNVLDFIDEHTKVLDANVEEHSIYFSRHRFFPETKEYKTVYTKAVWNEKTGLYEETELETELCKDFE